MAKSMGLSVQNPNTPAVTNPASMPAEYWMYRSRQAMADANIEAANVAGRYQLIAQGLQTLGSTLTQGLASMYQAQMQRDQMSERAREFQLTYELQRAESNQRALEGALKLKEMLDAQASTQSYAAPITAAISAINTGVSTGDVSGLATQLDQIDTVLKSGVKMMPNELGLYNMLSARLSQNPVINENTQMKLNEALRVVRGKGTALEVFKYNNPLTLSPETVAPVVKEALDLGLIGSTAEISDMMVAIPVAQSGNAQAQSAFANTVGADKLTKAKDVLARLPSLKKDIALFVATSRAGQLTARDVIEFTGKHPIESLAHTDVTAPLFEAYAAANVRAPMMADPVSPKWVVDTFTKRADNEIDPASQLPVGTLKEYFGLATKTTGPATAQAGAAENPFDVAMARIVEQGRAGTERPEDKSLWDAVLERELMGGGIASLFPGFGVAALGMAKGSYDYLMRTSDAFKTLNKMKAVKADAAVIATRANAPNAFRDPVLKTDVEDLVRRTQELSALIQSGGYHGVPTVITPESVLLSTGRMSPTSVSTLSSFGLNRDLLLSRPPQFSVSGPAQQPGTGTGNAFSQFGAPIK